MMRMVPHEVEALAGLEPLVDGGLLPQVQPAVEVSRDEVIYLKNFFIEEGPHCAVGAKIISNFNLT